MQHKQEEQILNPNSHIKPGENVATPMEKEQRKELLRFSKPYKAPPKPHKFKELKDKLEKTGKIYMEDFNDAKEIGMFLDFYNNNRKDEKAKVLGSLIHDITHEVVGSSYAIPQKEIEDELKKRLRPFDLQKPLIKI